MTILSLPGGAKQSLQTIACVPPVRRAWELWVPKLIVESYESELDANDNESVCRTLAADFRGDVGGRAAPELEILFSNQTKSENELLTCRSCRLVAVNARGFTALGVRGDLGSLGGGDVGDLLAP
jgi:hypothetical protein